MGNGTGTSEDSHFDGDHISRVRHRRCRSKVDCENDQDQDQQQPEQAVNGDASGNRRHEEDSSENDQTESQRAIPSAPRILAACRPTDKGLAGSPELAARESRVIAALLVPDIIRSA